MRWIHVALLLASVSLTVQAQPLDERVALAAERQAVVQRFAAEEAACGERFVVTPCIDDVRVRRRQALAPLRARELALDDRMRHQRAVERQTARDARVLRAAKAAAAASAAARQLPPESGDAAASGAHKPRVPPPLHNAAAEAAARAAQAAERAQAQQKRVQETQRTQAEIARRQSERKAGGKKSDPLPPPESEIPAKR